MSGLTPMMQQYTNIKQNYPDSLLMFRLGDFYELFFDDARTAARELDIVLTGRDGGMEDRIPMCGVPYHALDNYLARLLEKGYRVAIADQMEDPAVARGLVDRQVTRVVTPGTIIDEALLPDDRANYLGCLLENEDGAGFAYIDVAGGNLYILNEVDKDTVGDEILQIKPSEVLVMPSLVTGEIINRYVELQPYSVLTNGQEPWFDLKSAQSRLSAQWPEMPSIENTPPLAIIAAAALLYFLDHTQCRSLTHLKTPVIYRPDESVQIDAMSRRNLELTQNMRDQSKEGTLLKVLDHCSTAAGRRTLKQWIERPLTRINHIEKRQSAIQELLTSRALPDQLEPCLALTSDLERICARLGSTTASPRDLGAIRATLRLLPEIGKLKQSVKAPLLKQVLGFNLLNDLRLKLDQALEEELPGNSLQGSIIKSGYHAEADELKSMAQDGSKWLLDFEQREKERAGIKSLKVGYNKVFGYYIEITRANLSTIPADYIRKQTLVNGERFITEELKNYEHKILGSRESLQRLEYELFCELREYTAGFIAELQEVADCLGQLDCLLALARAAYLSNYVRPHIINERRCRIRTGRHPVVERNLKGERFVPNDTSLGPDHLVAIITGPNMGGKSTYIRQVALIQIMAQMGGFVPAEEAEIGIVDHIFARVGASDDLAAGHSTFMVEMTEVAAILKEATSRSLILLDEIGRGTSTYDGMSIARAVVEEMALRLKARTLFATHYHELTSLETMDGVFNLFVSVVEQGERVVFMRKVLPGKADRSYGIQVAQLAGIPGRVVERARVILGELESQHSRLADEGVLVQPGLFDDEHPVVELLRELDLDQIKPIEALQCLYEWKKMV
ncbi:MAG: DNA mismatch repair protein MutS [Methylocystaceae bacterium]